jgi:hypothetical protein
MKALDNWITYDKVFMYFCSPEKLSGRWSIWIYGIQINETTLYT